MPCAHKTAVFDLRRRVMELPPEAIAKPLLAGQRSVKDILAQLVWWDQRLVMTLPPAQSRSPSACLCTIRYRSAIRGPKK